MPVAHQRAPFWLHFCNYARGTGYVSLWAYLFFSISKTLVPLFRSKKDTSQCWKFLALITKLNNYHTVRLLDNSIRPYLRVFIAFYFVLSLLCLLFVCFLSTSEAQEAWHQALQQLWYSCRNTALFLVFLSFVKCLGTYSRRLWQVFKTGLWASIENDGNEERDWKCPARWMQQATGSSRELFLITLGCIPWSNSLYTLEIALSVRPYALQKQKSALCYLLISQKALVTLVKEKNKASGAGCLGCLVSFSGTCPKYVETLVSAPLSGESARPSVYSLQHFPYQVRTGARGWGLTEQQSGSDVPEPSENLLCLQKGRVPVRKMLQTWRSQVWPSSLFWAPGDRQDSQKRGGGFPSLSFPWYPRTLYQRPQWVKPQKLSAK